MSILTTVIIPTYYVPRGRDNVNEPINIYIKYCAERFHIIIITTTRLHDTLKATG